MLIRVTYIYQLFRRLNLWGSRCVDVPMTGWVVHVCLKRVKVGI